MNSALLLRPCSTTSLAAAEAPLDDAVGDGLGLLVGQHREQRHAADQVQIGQHRHRQSPRLWLVGLQRRELLHAVTTIPLLCPLTALVASPVATPMSSLVGFARRLPAHPSRSTAMSTTPHPRPGPDPRLRPGRLHRRDLRRARQPEADADHRHRPGRPADDHHRRRQLAGRRRRRAGPGPDAALPEACRALRHADRLRPHQRGRPGAAARSR